MNIRSVIIKEVSNNTVRKQQRNLILEIHNGFNRINFVITKNNLTYEDLENSNKGLDGFNVRGIFYARNCCKNSPIIILDSNREQDKEEITQLIHDSLRLIGDDIKKVL